MKNSVKISISMVVFSLAILFFGSCSKDDHKSSSLVSGGFNGRISATVDPDGWDLSPLIQVVPWNSPEVDRANNRILGTQMGDPVPYNNNKFSITLPDPPPSDAERVSIKYAFENYLGLSGTPKYSDPNVMVTDCDFLAVSNEGLTGYFLHTTADQKTTCFYVYAEKDVTVTGGTNVSVSLKQGWNRLYYSKGGNGAYTTKAPEEEMMWYYDNF
jgi:hypothetical protein